MTRQLVQETEHRLLEPICDFQEMDGYTVFKSEQFPNFWGGNGLRIVAAKNRSLDDWEAAFGQHFTPDVFRHKTFCFDEETEFEHLKEDAAKRNYQIEISTYMVASELRQGQSLSSDFEIHHVATEEEWDRLRFFYDDTAKDEDWYDESVGTRELFDKTRKTSEAVGINWFYISQVGSIDILAKAGIFRCGDICRLQDVMTAKAWRRKKLASMLVSFLIRRALEHTKGLACIADPHYVAIDLYRKLGFQECGNSVCLMKYPSRFDSGAKSQSAGE